MPLANKGSVSLLVRFVNGRFSLIQLMQKKGRGHFLVCYSQ